MTAPTPPAFSPSLSAVTLLVDDPETSREFYSRVFDAEPAWVDDDSIGFNVGSIVLTLLSSAQGDRLLTPAPVGRPGAGLRGQLSIWVDDIDTVVEVLTARGVVFDTPPTDRPWEMRTATFRDPDGHSWEIGQDLST